VTSPQIERLQGARGALGRGRPSDPLGASQHGLSGLIHAWARPLQIALYGLAGGVATTVWVTLTRSGGTPVDAWCFYAAEPAAPYWHRDYAFLYAPAAAQAMIPLQLLSFEAFVALLRAAELAALFALTGPFLPLVVFWSPVASEVNAANINLLIVAVAVWGLRWPALWSFVLLTKVTPGVGVLWFAVRREWRNLAIALGVTGVITAASFAWTPGLWPDWVAYLATVNPSDGVPLWARVLAAAAIVAWGARTDRPWAVVLAVTIATPRLYLQTPAMLVGLLYYVRPDLRGFLAWRQPASVGAP
jgi:hypothetical protein